MNTIPRWYAWEFYHVLILGRIHCEDVRPHEVSKTGDLARNREEIESSRRWAVGRKQSAVGRLLSRFERTSASAHCPLPISSPDQAYRVACRPDSCSLPFARMPWF